MSSNEPSVAVIGCGYWGKNIVRNFAELGQLRMVCDASEALAADMASRHGTRAASLETIAGDPGVRGVAIAAPAPLHAALATRFLGAGKHVFVEKPVALEIGDAEKLVALATRSGRLLMVGHLLNYHPAFLKACALVEAGTIGTPSHIYSNRLSFGKIRTEENVLWSFAPHDISMILRLAGARRPTTVTAHGGGYVSRGVDDFAIVTMAFDAPLTAHVFVSWRHPFKEQRLIAIGDKGAIVFDDTAPAERKLGVCRASATIVNGQPVLEKGDMEYVAFSAGEPLRAECQAFLDGMDNPGLVYTDGAEGLRVLDVLARAEHAMRSNREQE